MKGSKFLKVMSIIAIVSFFFSICFDLLAIFNLINGKNSQINRYEETYGEYINIAFILSMVLSVLMLVSGVIGIKNWKNPKGANKCVFIICFFTVLLIISSFVMAVVIKNLEPIFLIPSRLIISTLYLVAACQLKKMED